MVIRTALICGLALAASLNAQPPLPRGRGGPGGPNARFLGAEVGVPGSVVKNAPYSAEVVTETTQTLPDGNRIRQSTTARVYRDSEGRTRREQHVNGLAVGANAANLPQLAFINDPVAGTNFALDLTARTATSASFKRGDNWQNGRVRPGGAPPNPAGPRPAVRGRAGNQNVRTESLGKQMIEGVQAEGTRTTMTIPAGQVGNEQPIQVVAETWYSPELQTVVLRKRSDPRSGDSLTRYMNINRGDPPRTLFEVPADFKVAEAGGRGRPRQ